MVVKNDLVGGTPWRLPETSEVSAFRDGLEALCAALATGPAAEVAMVLPKRKNGTHLLMKPWLFEKLLAGEEFKSMPPPDIIAGQGDLKKLSLEQLLIIRKPMLRLKSGAAPSESHSTFITTVDSNILLQLTKRVFPEQNFEKIPDVARAISHQIVLVLGQASQLDRRALDNEFSRKTPPGLWLVPAVNVAKFAAICVDIDDVLASQLIPEGETWEPEDTELGIVTQAARSDETSIYLDWLMYSVDPKRVDVQKIMKSNFFIAGGQKLDTTEVVSHIAAFKKKVEDRANDIEERTQKRRRKKGAKKSPTAEKTENATTATSATAGVNDANPLETIKCAAVVESEDMIDAANNISAIKMPSEAGNHISAIKASPLGAAEEAGSNISAIKASSLDAAEDTGIKVSAVETTASANVDAAECQLSAIKESSSEVAEDASNKISAVEGAAESKLSAIRESSVNVAENKISAVEEETTKNRNDAENQASSMKESSLEVAEDSKNNISAAKDSSVKVAEDVKDKVSATKDSSSGVVANASALATSEALSAVDAVKCAEDDPLSPSNRFPARVVDRPPITTQRAPEQQGMEDAVRVAATISVPRTSIQKKSMCCCIRS